MKSSTPSRHPEPPFTEGGEVDVVLERHALAEPFREIGRVPTAVEAGNVRARGRTMPVACSTTPGMPTTVSSINSGERPAARTRASRNSTIGVERAFCVDPAVLDVLSRANRAGEIAERAAEEPRAEIDPEDERSLGDGLEVDGAVARAGGGGRGLAHEPGAEQRLEGQRDGRLRDARPPRDLRARDRRPAADRVEDGFLVQALQQRRCRHVPHSRQGCLPLQGCCSLIDSTCTQA